MIGCKGCKYWDGAACTDPVAGQWINGDGDLVCRFHREVLTAVPTITITRDGIIFCRYCGTAIGYKEGTDTAEATMSKNGRYKSSWPKEGTDTASGGKEK